MGFPLPQRGHFVALFAVFLAVDACGGDQPPRALRNAKGDCMLKLAQVSTCVLLTSTPQPATSIPGQQSLFAASRLYLSIEKSSLLRDRQIWVFSAQSRSLHGGTSWFHKASFF